MASVLEVLVNEMKLNDLVDTYNRVHNAALKMRGRSTVVFPAETVRGFFKPVLDSICTHVARLVAAHPVKYIFLVGGFAESQILQEAIKARFSSANRHVIVPVRPGLAVLRGAVQFGQNQDVFASRVARFSYGIAIACKYDSTDPVHARATTTTNTIMGKPVQCVPASLSQVHVSLAPATQRARRRARHLPQLRQGRNQAPSGPQGDSRWLDCRVRRADSHHAPTVRDAPRAC